MDNKKLEENVDFYDTQVNDLKDSIKNLRKIEKRKEKIKKLEKEKKEILRHMKKKPK